MKEAPPIEISERPGAAPAPRNDSSRKTHVNTDRCVSTPCIPCQNTPTPGERKGGGGKGRKRRDVEKLVAVRQGPRDRTQDRIKGRFFSQGTTVRIRGAKQRDVGGDSQKGRAAKEI